VAHGDAPRLTRDTHSSTQNGRSQQAPLERIRARRDAVAAAEQELDAAVSAARDAGCGWPDIAAALA
jgi:hypothetical protein